MRTQFDLLMGERTTRWMGWLLAALSTLPLAVQAEIYTRTEVIEYHDNLSRWVIGQVAKTTCVAPATVLPMGCGASGTVMSETIYDGTHALPLVNKRFNKTVQTLTWDTTSTVASSQLGTVKTVADGNGNVITPSSWKRGIPQSIKYPGTPELPSGATQSAVVNDAGWITSITDENSYTTNYTHDAMGRLTSIAWPTSDSTAWNTTTQVFQQIASAEYGIPANHWRQTISTGNGRKITYFDALWRPLVVREYDTTNEPVTQRFQRFTYDHEGRVTFASYSAMAHNPTIGTHTSYDALGRVVQVQQDSELSPSLLTTTEYLTGFQSRVTDPKGHQTTTSHLAWDQPNTDLPTHIAQTGNSHTHITRDVFGKPIQLRRSNSSTPGGGTGVDRAYAYNAYQEVCRSVEPETGATLMGYDNAGNLKWSAAGLPSGQACEANGTTSAVAARRVDRSYDARNRLTTLAFPDGKGNQSWGYTPDGLPASITTHNTSGGTVVSNNYAYNKRRLPVQETMVADALNTWALTYGYNANGHLDSHGYPAGLSTNYSVNALGQVTQITAQDVTTVNVVSDASYFPNGAIKSFTYGNGIIHTTVQNTRQLPEWIGDCKAAGSCLLADRVTHQQLTYDRNGNVTAINDHTVGGKQSRGMSYDTQDRLTQTTSSMFGTASYDYDVQDNLIRVTVGASGLYPARDHWYCYTSNRLDTVRTGSCSGGIVSSLGYDVQGNITSKGGQSFGFDYGNRLRNSGGVSQYLYDGHGRRVRYTGTGVTPYLYSQYDQTGKLRWQRDEQTNQRIRYIYLGNRLVAEHRKPIGINTPTIEYLHADALGSPIARTDAAKAIIETSEYEPYGRLVNRANDDKPGYTGHVQDAATGLTYMQQRYYDPMLGVFLSVDPVTAYSNPVGSFNRYKYAANNPYRFLDPDGRYESPAWMRATIPGQATWDHAVTSFQAGNYGQAAVQGVVAIAEGTAGIMTLGQAQAGASAGRVAFQEVAAINAGKQGAVESAETLSKVNPKTLLGRQGRDEMSGSQVKRLVSDMKANGFDASKPVDIANVGGKKVIIDGHHRTEAAIKAGIQEIPARTVPVTEQQGAQLMQEAAEVRRLRGN